VAEITLPLATIGNVQDQWRPRGVYNRRNDSNREKLDVAIEGDGFFEVQMPDGTRAYTRDGALKMGSDGRITTSDGLALQGGFQPVPAGTTSVTISPDGEVTYDGASGLNHSEFKL
jgi:flagellar basal body rod protein FlgG